MKASAIVPDQGGSGFWPLRRRDAASTLPDYC
jgi:hypothetical protein